jgi:hypothetical protein
MILVRHIKTVRPMLARNIKTERAISVRTINTIRPILVQNIKTARAILIRTVNTIRTMLVQNSKTARAISVGGIETASKNDFSTKFQNRKNNVSQESSKQSERFQYELPKQSTQFLYEMSVPWLISMVSASMSNSTFSLRVCCKLVEEDSKISLTDLPMRWRRLDALLVALSKKPLTELFELMGLPSLVDPPLPPPGLRLR